MQEYERIADRTSGWRLTHLGQAGNPIRTYSPPWLPRKAVIASLLHRQHLQTKQISHRQSSRRLQFKFCIAQVSYPLAPTHWSTHQIHHVVCSYPPEYCEFGEHLTRCKEWLQEAHPNLYEKYYSDGWPDNLIFENMMLTGYRGATSEDWHSKFAGSGKA